ncbi:hypothetical protein IC617_08860 [Neiella sp. HB171785]|uniref:Imelysin family protein n=1 Tax=Neiella litorisoli TaxID=2771431 RepID=A0A8J6UPU9_9GAMM|nr:hypothetical protein [Neiella litorisoli]MBD1389537.1 hypothetical protein [Neiella litorisoli]
MRKAMIGRCWPVAVMVSFLLLSQTTYAKWHEDAVVLSAETANNYLNGFRRSALEQILRQPMTQQPELSDIQASHPNSSWLTWTMVWLDRQQQQPIAKLYELLGATMPKLARRYSGLTLEELTNGRGALVVARQAMYTSCGDNGYAPNLAAINVFAQAAGDDRDTSGRAVSLMLVSYLVIQAHHPFNVLRYSSCARQPMEQQLCLKEDAVSCKLSFEQALRSGHWPSLPDNLESYSLDIELQTDAGFDLQTLASESVAQARLLLNDAKGQRLDTLNSRLVERLALAGQRIGYLLGAKRWFEQDERLGGKNGLDQQ